MRKTSPRRTAQRGATFVHMRLGSAVVAPPPLKPEQVRCPVCRNGVQPTLRGYLRLHKDLFGHDCHNRAIDP